MGDLRLKGGYALNVQAFHKWRTDVLEQIVLPSGVPSLANAGSARVWGIETEAAVPLTGFLKGGLLEVSADFRDAAFTDPITGQSRVVTDLTTPEITIDFRQDLAEARFAWGRATSRHRAPPPSSPTRKSSTGAEGASLPLSRPPALLA